MNFFIFDSENELIEMDEEIWKATTILRVDMRIKDKMTILISS